MAKNWARPGTLQVVTCRRQTFCPELEIAGQSQQADGHCIQNNVQHHPGILDVLISLQSEWFPRADLLVFAQSAFSNSAYSKADQSAGAATPIAS